MLMKWLGSARWFLNEGKFMYFFLFLFFYVVDGSTNQSSVEYTSWTDESQSPITHLRNPESFYLKGLKTDCEFLYCVSCRDVSTGYFTWWSVQSLSCTHCGRSCAFFLFFQQECRRTHGFFPISPANHMEVAEPQLFIFFFCVWLNHFCSQLRRWDHPRCLTVARKQNTSFQTRFNTCAQLDTAKQNSVFTHLMLYSPIQVCSTSLYVFEY